MKHADIVMIRPGSDPGAGAADGLGTPPSASPRLILRAALSVALPPVTSRVVVCGLRVSRETGRPEEQLQVLDRQLDRGRETGHQLEVLQERAGHLQGTAEAIRDLDQRRSLTPHLLETVERSTSKMRGLWLSRLHLDLSGLLIRGQSLQAAPIGALMASLRKSPLLKQIQLRSRSRDQETGVWDFEMKALLESNEHQ